ncbi:Polyketide synthase PksL [Methyloligella halotolerans]|uniref:Polyketide synthase PksL n=1 Tax=Methyloligella halotolerans TaxID=1177755 RepID=A0A1E2RYU2_9HYPH|nr:ketoacyl-synthetase C-terminal extension domain-containing protein [Methyloligella halotolerans]ODA67381.1 Polyketide synthase PksL [Methyloligella halotolerans]
MIKALLALNHRQIPANLHFQYLNPKIDLAGTPFFVPDEPVSLDPEARLAAGISSFGFGGANAHAVLESYANPAPGEDEDRPCLIPLSARTRPALIARTEQLLAYLSVGGRDDAPQALPIPELSAELGLGRLPETAGPMPLRALRLEVSDLAAVLKRIGRKRGIDLALDDVRDCVTLGELSACIGELTCIAPSHRDSGERLLSGVAIPDRAVRDASLVQIGFSLTEGRDAMAERLAIVARSKQELKQQLEQFLAEPEATADGLFSGSVRRPIENAPEAPSSPDAPATVEELAAWARYWVAVRTAKLDWMDLHGGPRPRKIPLPSYPFALTRHWFESPKTAEPETAPEKAAAPITPLATPAEKPRPASADPVTPEALVRRFPSSAVALAYLLDHLAKQSNGATITLRNLVFGAPQDIDLRHLKAVGIASGGLTMAQCLHQLGTAKVLLQAEIAANLSAPHFGGGTAGSRVTLGPIAEAERSAPFWAAIFGPLFGAEGWIAEPDAPALSALYRADAVGFEPRRKASLAQIEIRRTQGGSFDFLAGDGTAPPILWIENLTVKPAAAAPSGQQPREEALAS